MKLCIGHPWEWFGIVKAMLESKIYPDFVVVDGAEGGTGAAPLEFSDHIGMPLQEGLRLVHNTLVGAGLREHIRVGASGKIVSAFDMARAFALGADWCNSARGFMFALGCIQAQTCHTGNCPTGVTTQDPKRQMALVVPSKADRVENFHRNTLEALQALLEASGLHEPHELSPRHIMQRVSETQVLHLSELVDTVAPLALLQKDISSLPVTYQDWPHASASRFGLNA
jgi:glutamate synthase domain-containing protein 2